MSLIDMLLPAAGNYNMQKFYCCKRQESKIQYDADYTTVRILRLFNVKFEFPSEFNHLTPNRRGPGVIYTRRGARDSAGSDLCLSPPRVGDGTTSTRPPATTAAKRSRRHVPTRRRQAPAHAGRASAWEKPAHQRRRRPTGDNVQCCCCLFGRRRKTFGGLLQYGGDEASFRTREVSATGRRYPRDCDFSRRQV